MSSAELQKEALAYISKTRFGLLTYVRSDKSPVTRAMGSFALDGINIVFSTQTKAAKVPVITADKRISFFFEQDNQEPAKWINALVIGDAESPQNDSEKDRLITILSQRNPKFKEKVEKDGLTGTSIFILKTKEIQYLNRSNGLGTTTIISGNE
jgi:pyridoxamine 5'-phosphate oxidase